jgi:hypothetical protein
MRTQIDIGALSGKNDEHHIGFRQTRASGDGR